MKNKNRLRAIERKLTTPDMSVFDDEEMILQSQWDAGYRPAEGVQFTIINPDEPIPENPIF